MKFGDKKGVELKYCVLYLVLKFMR